jgi:hypothetical protein
VKQQEDLLKPTTNKISIQINFISNLTLISCHLT